MKNGEKKALIIVLILLLAAVFISGCVGQGPSTTIKSNAEAAQHITNISNDVEDVTTTLNDIDNKIG